MPRLSAEFYPLESPSPSLFQLGGGSDRGYNCRSAWGLRIQARSLTIRLKQLVWALAPEQRCKSVNSGVLCTSEKYVQDSKSLI